MTDEARAGEPRTLTGRDMLANRDWMRRPLLPLILAIEREAAAIPALDVERLARVLWSMRSDPGTRYETMRGEAQTIAAEYARLSEKD